LSTPEIPNAIDAKVREAALSPRRLFANIEDRLRESERIFREELASPVRIVDEIGRFVGDAGGKRVRPALHLLASRMLGYAGPHDVTLAAVLEYIHSATLIHDDIIDEAATRRGRPSVNYRWPNPVSVLFGDFLYAQAMRLALRAESLAVMDTLANVTLRMVEGELLQTRYVGRLDLTLDEYFDLVERKTSGLFAGCCVLAGHLVRADDERMRALETYGRNLGTAFQCVDDVLDVVGDPSRLGKPAGADLLEGKATLPYLLWLRDDSDGRRRTRLERIVRKPEAEGSEAVRRELREAMDRDGAIDAARERARRAAGEARDALRLFPRNEARESLESLPDLLMARDR